MHYYQHNIGDYARDTGHLSVLEHGIYRLLLDWCYLNEKPITTEQAIRVSRGNPTETHSVLSEFFSEESGGWIHKRVQREVGAYYQKVATNRQNGAKGGRPKPRGNPVGSQAGGEINPNQEPRTINQEPLTKEEQYSAEVSSQVAVAPKPKPAKDVLGVDFLIAQGCEESHARDWMKARRAKKAPLTETAWDGLCREARKAGISPSEAVRMCAARSWASLKAEWLTKDQGHQETTYQRTMREKYEKWVPSLAAKAPAAKRDVFEVIDEVRPTTPPALG